MLFSRVLDGFLQNVGGVETAVSGPEATLQWIYLVI